ncbi:MAG: hypothetical protein Q7K42_00315 [Candidatus Diapherotrites archaeon]|nr:hypothetical protein [Candidatus Diapherotrites archaeon]
MEEKDPEFAQRELLQKIFRLFIENRDLGLRLFVLNPKVGKTRADYDEIRKAKSRIGEISKAVNVVGKQYFRIVGIRSEKTPFVYLGEIFGPLLVRALLVKHGQPQKKIPSKIKKRKESEDDFLSKTDLRKIFRALKISPIVSHRRKVPENKKIGLRPVFRLGIREP